MLVTGLKRIDHTEDLCSISTRRGRIGHDQSNGLLGVDDEDGADGEGDTLFVDVGGILLVEHIIEQCDLSLLVAYDWKLELGATDLIDILDPTAMTLDGVGREANELHAALGELGL